MTRTLPLLAALLLASPALAQEADCSSQTQDGGSFTYVSEAVDLGGGIVAQSTAYGGDNGSGLMHVHEDTSFEFCATGRGIGVSGNHVPTPGTEPTDVAAIVLDAIASPKPITLDDLAGRIDATTAWGGGVSEASSTESCGCALFYPGLRHGGGAP